MIVPSMTHKELMKEIKIDVISVGRKACFLADNLRRAAIKSKVKPLERWDTYKTNRKNNWLIFIKHYGKGYELYPFVWYVGEYGINIIHPDQNDGDNFNFYHFTSHFFKRYNERFLKENLSVIDIFKRYFIRNMDTNSRTNGGFESQIMGIVADGVIFGTAEKDLYNLYITYRTFISNEMILEFQKKDIKLIEDFKNGKVFESKYV